MDKLTFLGTHTSSCPTQRASMIKNTIYIAKHLSHYLKNPIKLCLMIHIFLFYIIHFGLQVVNINSYFSPLVVWLVGTYCAVLIQLMKCFFILTFFFFIYLASQHEYNYYYVCRYIVVYYTTYSAVPTQLVSIVLVTIHSVIQSFLLIIIVDIKTCSC